MEILPPPRPDLRRRVLAGELTIGCFVGLGNPTAAELAARAGFDWLVLDLEHGAGTEAELLPQLLAVQATTTAACVRVVSAERLRIGRVLDLGADGVMLPRVDTLDEARSALGWMHYPPAGTRGVAAITRGAGYLTVPHARIRELHARILGIVQVESEAAVDAAPAVAALEGVDVLFVGPADLSHAMGIPGETGDPRFVAALDRVVAAATAAGKAAGILLYDSSEAPRYAARGFRFIGVGSDVALLAGATRSLAAAARAALG